MSKFKAILTGLLGTAFNLPADEVAELLNKTDEEIDSNEVLKTLREKDKERVSTLRKTGFDDGFKKAEKKIKTEVEAKLKTKFEIDSEKEGDDLLDEIFEAAKPKAAGKPKDLTDDDVKRHPAYVSMENQFKKQVEDQKKTFEEQISTKEKEYQKKEVFTSVGKKALEIFEGLNPILSSDATKAANQKSDLLNKFSGFEFEMVEGKVIISKEGKVLEDEHGHKVDFEKFVKSTAEKFFDFKAAEDRSPADAGKDDKNKPPTKTAFTGAMPKTKEEYVTAISDPKVPLADRIAIRDAAPPEFKQ